VSSSKNTFESVQHIGGSAENYGVMIQEYPMIIFLYILFFVTKRDGLGLVHIHRVTAFLGRDCSANSRDDRHKKVFQTFTAMLT
jgi:hypothetical protein